MELTIGVAIGSSIQVRPRSPFSLSLPLRRTGSRSFTCAQIGVGLIPILVIVGWIINQDLTLFFECVPPFSLVRLVSLERTDALNSCDLPQEL